MKCFKFFQKPYIGSRNRYIDFDMDECVIQVLRYKQYNNEQIINTPTLFYNINVPISDSWITITTWRNIQPTYPLPERIEIDYTIYTHRLEVVPINFTLRMDTEELLNRIQIERV